MHHRLWILGLAFVLGASSALAQTDIEEIRSRSDSADAEALAELDESISIMARVLRKSIERRFEARETEETDRQGETAFGTKKSQNQQNANLALFAAIAAGQDNQRQVTSSRGFVLPGVGVVFVINVELPVEKVEQPSDASLWDEAKDEIERGTSAREASNPFLAYGGQVAEKYRFAKGHVGDVRDAVLEALAQNGRRLEGVGNDQSVFVTIRLGSRSALAWIADGRNLVIRIPMQSLGDLGRNARADDLQPRVTMKRY